MGEAPGVPLKLWTKPSIMEIFNKIGKFYFVDEGCLGVLDKRVAWVLVEVDYMGGLPPSLDIIQGPISFRW